MKPRVVLLLPLWQPTAVQRFGQFALASLLSRRNLPALAELSDFELRILTTAAGKTALAALPGNKTLQEISAPSFVDIEDLVLDSSFAVTPTLSYLRGMQASGERAPETSFILWNPEFIIADGALLNLGRKIAEGHSVLLGNVMLATAERLAPRLRARLPDEGAALEIPPRELVRMVLDCLHPLEVGAVVNSRIPLSTRSGRILWGVDDMTMIARQFSPALLCLKPEHVVDKVTATFDASFIPTMTPSAAPLALTDSDDFLAVELREHKFRQHDLVIGRSTVVDTARQLSTWATQANCQHALSHSFTIHADEIPAISAAVTARMDGHVRQLVAMVSPVVKSHENHPHWRLAYYLWQLRRFELGMAPAPTAPFSEGSQAGHAGRLRDIGSKHAVRTPHPSALGWKQRLFHSVFGRPPFVRIWHPDWTDYRPAADALEPFLKAPNASFLHVADSAPHFTPLMGPPSTTPADVLSDEQDQDPLLLPQDVDVVLVNLQEEHLPHIGKLIDRLQPLVRRGGKIIVYYRHLENAERPELSEVVVPTLLSLPLYPSLSIAFAGGAQKRWLRQEFGVVPSYLATWRRPLRVFKGLILLAGLLAQTVKLNRQMAEIQDQRMSIDPLSSFVISLSVPAGLDAAPRARQFIDEAAVARRTG